jgi:RimJ/RimL family protein N-acetyltransferase
MNNERKIIQGEKISLRPMKPKEVELIYRWANNPDVMPYWYGRRRTWYGRRRTLKQIKDDWKPHYFSDKDPHSGRCFAIEVNDEPIGMVNYNKIDRENKSVDMDIMIGQKEQWDKGYGTDALKTFCGFLFIKFKLNRIWLGAYIYNVRAIRAYEKAGFKKEGILREEALINGKFVDSVLLSILRKEFKK